jgi:hypothetical protein
MINGKDNPVEWAMLGYELDEVAEHVQNLSKLITPDANLPEEEFEVYMGHIYAHLNRIWNSRNHVGEVGDDLREKYTQFPLDIRFFG